MNAATVASAALSAVAFVLAISPVYAGEPTEVDLLLSAYRQPGGPCDAGWREEFRVAQGHLPEDRDCLDRGWSLRFVHIHGRLPADADWQRHYYLLNPPPPPGIPDPDDVEDAEDG
ncbi:MAG: hypothetical protein HYY05_06285 [Chloroflexi bacterium]|nr:hypothetical protein [Chloroflexota bacterium]